MEYLKKFVKLSSKKFLSEFLALNEIKKYAISFHFCFLDHFKYSNKDLRCMVVCFQACRSGQTVLTLL